MKKRGDIVSEILDLVSDEHGDRVDYLLCDFISDCVNSFNEIRDLLDKLSIDKLDNVYEAYKVADEASSALY